jgi:hypothetical protein
MVKSSKVVQLFAFFFMFETLYAFGETPAFNYKLNSQLANERDPVNVLLKEDNMAGAVGRFIASASSGVGWVQKGYYREIGDFTFQLHEADMPTDKSMGVQGKVGYKLIGNWLKLSLENDAPLRDLSVPIQTANLLLQVRM